MGFASASMAAISTRRDERGSGARPPPYSEERGTGHRRFGPSAKRGKRRRRESSAGGTSKERPLFFLFAPGERYRRHEEQRGTPLDPISLGASLFLLRFPRSRREEAPGGETSLGGGPSTLAAGSFQGSSDRNRLRPAKRGGSRRKERNARPFSLWPPRRRHRRRKEESGTPLYPPGEENKLRATERGCGRQKVAVAAREAPGGGGGGGGGGAPPPPTSPAALA